ncbi:MAG: 30S ribosomal protein S17 [bacterium]|nr:30S ribosomal protein S17 [bacterium]
MTEEKNKKITSHRTLVGAVVSDSMSKTIVVRVDRTVVHPKYGKRYIQGKKYHVHDEENAFHVGDIVSFEESRPISRNKRWCVVGKIEKK